MQRGDRTTDRSQGRFAAYLRNLGGLAELWLDLAFPPECVVCRAPLDATDELGLCPGCRQGLASPAASQCPRCAATLGAGDVGKDDCRHCRGEKFAFASVIALNAYSGPLRDVVLRMKHPPGELLSLVVGRLLAVRLQEEAHVHDDDQEGKSEGARPPVDLVVPMPMAWRRRLVRGMNAPELLAESISRRLARPVRRALRFRRNVLQQSTLTPSRRRDNVRRALAVIPGYPLAEATILLVDDILTTGATANEAARCLKKAGAKEVRVAVAARGIGFD